MHSKFTPFTLTSCDKNKDDNDKTSHGSTSIIKSNARYQQPSCCSSASYDDDHDGTTTTTSTRIGKETTQTIIHITANDYTSGWRTFPNYHENSDMKVRISRTTTARMATLITVTRLRSLGMERLKFHSRHKTLLKSMTITLVLIQVTVTTT